MIEPGAPAAVRSVCNFSLIYCYQNRICEGGELFFFFLFFAPLPFFCPNSNKKPRRNSLNLSSVPEALMADEKTEDSQGVHSPPLASPRESLSDSEISWTSNEEEVDQDLASVDFSSDFTSGPGRTDIIKAIASRWSKYAMHTSLQKGNFAPNHLTYPSATLYRNIVKKAGQRIDKVVKIQVSSTGYE